MGRRIARLEKARACGRDRRRAARARQDFQWAYSHWVGAKFLPGVSIEQVMAVLTDYDRYKDIYAPMITKSKLLERSDRSEKVNLLLVGKAVGVIGAVDTDDEIQTVKLDSTRIYTVSNSIRAQEISDYGKPSEHLLPQDQGPGYVWRTFGITRLMQRDGGVYWKLKPSR